MEALLFTIDGQRYGVWKDQVLSVESVEAVHRLPFLKSSLTVLAVIGDHTRALVELPQCLGHGPQHQDGEANALVMSDTGQLRGFVIGASLSSREAGPETVVALPEYLQIPFTDSFLSDNGELVPLVAVRDLFEQVLKEGKAPHLQSRAVGDLPAEEPRSSAPFKLILAGDFLWAVQAPDLASISERVKIARFPLIPGDIDGVAAVENHLLPVVDVSRRVSSRETGERTCLLRAGLGGAAAVLRVDGTRGQWKAEETRVMDLPPLCRNSWMQKAALHAGQIAPIIDLATLISHPSAAADLESAARHYSVDSPFPSLFGKETVEVHEVLVRGKHWAIPKVEAIDVIDSVPVFALAGQSGIVAGVAEQGGELLPVLDLSRIMGSTESPPTTGKMILCSNGNFRALIPAQSVPEVKRLTTSLQREVPVSLPFPVVYGCYTEGESVRLILNMRELALHFDESRARDLLPPLSPFEVVFDEESVAPNVEGAQAEPEPVHGKEATPTITVEFEPVDVPLPAPAAEEPFTAEMAAEAPAETVVGATTESGIAAPTGPELPQPETESFPTVSASLVEEERLPVEQPGSFEQAVPARPIHRGWRMLVAFVASAVLIVGVVVGLHFSGLAQEPQVTAASVQTPSATQPQQPSAVQPQQSQATPAAQQPPASKQGTTQPAVGTIYVVKEGDTLWDISNRLTGNPFNYHSIAGQNRIANPDLIFPGQALQTPTDTRTSQ